MVVPYGNSLGCMHFGVHNVFLVRSTAWAGAPDAGLGAIMLWPLCSDRHMSREPFKDCQGLPGVLSEMRQVSPCTSSSFPSVPMVLTSRFKDTVYLVGMKLHDGIILVVCEGLTHLPQLICNLELKWEAHGGMIAQGEDKLGVAPD